MTSSSDIEKGRNEIRISQLPNGLRESAKQLVKELDTDGDGAIDAHEFAAAVTSLTKGRTQNRNLIKALVLLSFGALALIGSMFGVSIAAARLAKDTETGALGILQDKVTGSVVKTGEALIKDSTSVLDMATSQLQAMKKLVLMDGEVQFEIKGFARSTTGEQVMMNVEGGTITFDKEGILNATGTAKQMLELAEGLDNDGRRLSTKDYETIMSIDTSWLPDDSSYFKGMYLKGMQGPPGHIMKGPSDEMMKKGPPDEMMKDQSVASVGATKEHNNF